MMAIPRTYDEWLRCITHDCGIVLTRAFVQERIRQLRDEDAPDTARFIERYGDQHRRGVLGWFERAMTTLP
ncbi:MAG: hypothetical protein QM724_00900 [Flavobacteriales bacterium]